jgi:uncharacterized protein (TIRG00374 family)
MKPASPTSARTWAIGVLSLIVGGGALWLSLRDVSKAEVLAILRDVSFLPLAGSLAVYLAATSIRGLRWYRLLKDRTRQPFAAAQTLYVGFAVNNLLPARLGELFRVEYTFRRLRIPRGYCAGALLGERLIDLACLGVVVLVGLLLLPTTHADARVHDLANIGWTFVILLAVAVSVVALVIGLRPSTGRQRTAKPPAAQGWVNLVAMRLRAEVKHAESALRAHTARDLVVISMLSVAIWSLEGTTLYLVGASLGISVPFAGIALLLFVSSLATLIPSAPGYIGTYQLAFVIALSFVGTAPSVAVTAATVQQVVNIGLATLVGLSFLAMAPARQP